MIVFENPGEMDLLALTTHGLSVKEHDNPIGRFGTGLKYALAVLMREGAHVTVVSGQRWIDIESEPRAFRGKEFDFVIGRPQSEPPFELGFTTRLGRDWELWQAFRELYANTLDEHGEIKRFDGEPYKRQCHTMIFVSHPEIEALYDDRGTIFLQTQPLWANERMEIHPGESRYVFYRGVRTMKLKQPSRHTYNVTSFELLTEDRTFRYDFMIHDLIRESLAECDDPAVIEAAINHGQGCYEHKIDYSDIHTSDRFARTVAAIRSRREHNLSPSAENVALRVPVNVSENETAMDTEMAGAVRAAALTLKPLGIDVAKYPIVYCGEVPNSMKTGWAARGRIYLTAKAMKTRAALLTALLLAAADLRTRLGMYQADWLAERIGAYLAGEDSAPDAPAD